MISNALLVSLKKGAEAIDHVMNDRLYKAFKQKTRGSITGVSAQMGTYKYIECKDINKKCKLGGVGILGIFRLTWSRGMLTCYLLWNDIERPCHRYAAISKSHI